MSSPITTGIIGMVVLLCLMAGGMPIGFGMLLIGFTGFAYLVKFSGATHILATVPYNLISNYDYSVLPLFLLMAGICLHSGLAKSLFSLVYTWIGRLHGGLAVATIGACAMFAAASASSLATAVTIGIVAIPEMRSYKYDSALATGCVAAGGALGILIPPSGILILYGIITEQSISELFIAGIIPGVILASLFMIMIYIRARLNPMLAPQGPKTSFQTKMAALGRSFEMILLLLLVIVGLIIGWFTPTEAGAIGALGAILLSLVRRRLTWDGFRKSLYDSLRDTGLIFTIILGAFVFNAFLAVSTIPMEVASWVGNLGLPPIVIMIIIIFVYILLGCFVETLSMVLLTIPIFFPVATSLGFDPVWFGIVIVMVCEIGMITPPVGVNVFVIHGISKNVPIQTVFKGIMPFLLVEIAFIALLLFFPQIALFLPNMGK
ncbi:MAG: TRAP transporter large permease subunit [Dehalococcoidales bacterium]|nr:TRAP transporter large permease subunit [Dehalococcoidales bacterium]